LRAYIIATLLLLVIFGGISGYLYRQFSALASSDFSPPPVAINADTASTAQWANNLEAVGTIGARRGIELSTEESGEITSIDMTSGQQVKAGDLLLSLNDKVEIASLERQKANLKLARLLFERDNQLVEQKSIPQSQYDRSRADLESATAQLAETEARLENKQVIAPFDGTVGIVKVKVGDYASPGTRITTLQDLSELEVDFTLPARHYPNLKPGQQISVAVAAYPGKQFMARLVAVDSHVEAATRNLMLRAKIDDATGLLPGMFASLTITLNEADTVVSVPETAVTYSLHGNTIWTIEKVDGRDIAESRIVKTGKSIDGKTQVLEGLEDGELIVTSGQNKLFSGAEVSITPRWETSQ
jgi:membrane fusion protein, multidrug efflux system